MLKLKAESVKHGLALSQVFSDACKYNTNTYTYYDKHSVGGKC